MCRELGCRDEEPVLLTGIYRATMLLHNSGARPSQKEALPADQPRPFCLTKAALCNSRRGGELCPLRCSCSGAHFLTFVGRSQQ